MIVSLITAATVFVTVAAFAQTPAANAVVAQDGSGQYQTIQEAINAAPQETSATRRWIIAIRPGTYQELLYVQREKRFVMLVGDDPSTTIVTYGLKAGDMGPDGKPIGTFRTPTAVIDADDFSAENLTFENSAGPNGQALALRVDGDRAVFRNCRFLGWQDTIFLDRGRHYFEDSLIAGHVDFIFGGATAWFERCRLHAWRNGYLTAASTPAETPYGFVFARGLISGAEGVQTYLGRPWRPFAQTMFIDTEMSAVVRPEGWHNWDKPEREATVRYGESGSSGPGGHAERRVVWANRPLPRGVKKITVTTVLGGSDRWSPALVPAHPSRARALDAPLPAPPGPR